MCDRDRVPGFQPHILTTRCWIANRRSEPGASCRRHLFSNSTALIIRLNKPPKKIPELWMQWPSVICRHSRKKNLRHRLSQPEHDSREASATEFVSGGGERLVRLPQNLTHHFHRGWVSSRRL